MDDKQLQNNFMYHSPKGSQPARYEAIRAMAKQFAEMIQGSCPDSREKALAFTKLEESVMWANASVARNE